jgi:hypothetical protein
LQDTLIDDQQPWRLKHLKSIEANYRKAPYFKANFPRMESLLSIKTNNLCEFCWEQLIFWVEEFQIQTRIIRASALNIVSKKSKLILDLCQHLGASQYLTGQYGRDYLDINSFDKAGIEIIDQDFHHPVYPQLSGEFEPYMGILDYWMNSGPGKLTLINQE